MAPKIGAWLLALCLAAAAPSATAAPAPQWNFDPPHCSVMFMIDHIFAQIPGAFRQFSGTVRFDPANLAGSSVEVTIQTASVDTAVKARDQHLRTPDFFDVAKYPVMKFVSTEIEKTGENKFVAHGKLTIKGETQKFDLPFTFLGSKENPMKKGQQVAGFSARASLDRLAFKVGDGKFVSMGVVGKEVRLIIELELVR